jgi:hypothetical protein
LAAPAAAKGLGLGLDAPVTGLGPGAVGGLAKGLAAGAADLLAAAKGLAAGTAGLSLGLVGVFAKGVAAVVGPVLDLWSSEKRSDGGGGSSLPASFFVPMVVLAAL